LHELSFAVRWVVLPQLLDLSEVVFGVVEEVVHILWQFRLGLSQLWRTLVLTLEAGQSENRWVAGVSNWDYY